MDSTETGDEGLRVGGSSLTKLEIDPEFLNRGQ